MPVHRVPVEMSPCRWQRKMWEWVPQGGKKKGEGNNMGWEGAWSCCSETFRVCSSHSCVGPAQAWQQHRTGLPLSVPRSCPASPAPGPPPGSV